MGFNSVFKGLIATFKTYSLFAIALSARNSYSLDKLMDRFALGSSPYGLGAPRPVASLQTKTPQGHFGAPLFHLVHCYIYLCITHTLVGTVPYSIL